MVVPGGFRPVEFKFSRKYGSTQATEVVRADKASDGCKPILRLKSEDSITK